PLAVPPLDHDADQLCRHADDGLLRPGAARSLRQARRGGADPAARLAVELGLRRRRAARRARTVRSRTLAEAVAPAARRAHSATASPDGTRTTRPEEILVALGRQESRLTV